MELLPFFLVLISVVTHAYWNFLAKRAENKDIFMGLCKMTEVFLFAIPFFIVLVYEGFDLSRWYFVVVAALLVFLNYIFLLRAYKHIDLSVAYPISRASTLFLPFIAYYCIDERINSTGMCALVLVTLGVFVMHCDALRDKSIAGVFRLLRNPGTLYALLAAFTVAAYTVWDKVAIRHIYPFLYFYAYTTGVAIFYGILTLTNFNKTNIYKEWRNNGFRIVQVAFLNTFTYMLILIALGLSKASYVGALRQLSLVVGVFLGWKFLKESLSPSRIAGVILLVAGGGLTVFGK